MKSLPDNDTYVYHRYISFTLHVRPSAIAKEQLAILNAAAVSRPFQQKAKATNEVPTSDRMVAPNSRPRLRGTSCVT